MHANRLHLPRMLPGRFFYDCRHCGANYVGLGLGRFIRNINGIKARQR